MGCTPTTLRPLWRLAAGLLLLAGLLLGGCTAEKARALTAAATQFEVESLAAIDLLAEMGQKEQEAPPKSDTEAAADFFENVRDWERPLILPDQVEFLLDPDSETASEEAIQAWNELLDRLRVQYQTFASIYDRLEEGSYLAADAVEASRPHALVLSAQMVTIAKQIESAPPRFLKYRGSYTGELNLIKRALGEGSINEQTAQRQVAQVRERWLLMRQAEKELERRIVEQCLKSAALGVEVRDLIDSYKQLDIDTINILVAKALDTAGALSGRDLTALRGEATTILAKVESDPAFRRVAEGALTTVNSAIAGRGN